ncbi:MULTISPECIES: DUF1493 family protein [unclassified Brenneria]|uniref:DUF1493 family protein n=1 Tax=unclassified Brenneria TaxID=2634434 RepID=UPI0029C38413|nr:MULTISPECIES: DUF1493 family protein [unclassified Brenneria]MDX5626839.1 DUF1493 family protein [Brenneria sp. L3-3Z]MDX5693811.1 DUF1493 family protein [Brenneria sp. L4-2C]
MEIEDIEKRVYDLVRPYAGEYLFSLKTVVLAPETDLDTNLGIDELEVGDLMDEFFKEFKVEKGNFNIKTYFPDPPMSWNPFKKAEPIPVPDFTIGMLIESAKAGRWLYVRV